MKILIILPILIPLLTGIASLLVWNHRRLQRVLSVVGAAALLGAAGALLACVHSDGIQAAQMGGWEAPFGITLVADLLSAIMVFMAGLMGLAVAIYSLSSMDAPRERFGYYPLLHILLMGVCGAFLTGDMFNLYVWFEVMLIASFVLLALGGERAQLEGAIKYVTLNLISSAIFLAAVGMVYGLTGTLNMADLAEQLDETPQRGMVTTLSMLFLVAFGIKAAVFPLFFWLPASYHTPPVAVSAIFAALLTKVGVYAIIRVFTLLFVQDIPFTHGIILVIAGFTMVTGVLGAAAQSEFRRILSFHKVSQIGYIVMGVGMWTPLALTGTVFYIIHYIIVKTNLFLVSGLVHRLRGTYQLKPLGGLYRSQPYLSILFMVSAMSLAGIPPLSGFWAKLVLVRAGLETGQYVIIAAALAVSLLTLFSMVKIWAEAFWKPEPEAEPASDDATDVTTAVPENRPAWPMYLPVVVFAAMTIAMGLFTEPIFNLATSAAEQLLDRQQYITAVLGEEGARP